MDDLISRNETIRYINCLFPFVFCGLGFMQRTATNKENSLNKNKTKEDNQSHEAEKRKARKQKFLVELVSDECNDLFNKSHKDWPYNVQVLLFFILIIIILNTYYH